jgi:LysM repeat protein
MKKLLFGAALAAGLLALSCGSAPASAPAPAPAPEAQAADPNEYTQAQANTDYVRVYETYRPKIILDGAKKYTVVKGDTLSHIAVANYGRANNYGYFFPLIVMASDEAVPDPDLIEPGMVLTIPDLQKNLDNPAARQAIKDFLKEVAGSYHKKERATSLMVEEDLIALSDSL